MVPLSISPIKIAFIGYDRSSLLAFDYLSTLTPFIDFYIVKTDQNPDFRNFSWYSIAVDHLMIPSVETDRTNQHKESFKKIKDNYYKFQEYLGIKNGVSSDVQRGETKTSEPKIISTSDILDIKADLKTKKIFIEIKQKGLEPYDLLIVEDHTLIEQEFYARSIKYFKNIAMQANTWMGYEFEVEYSKPLTAPADKKEFWFVNQSENTSLLDNWFLICTESTKMLVWQWIPTAQLDNPQFDEFMSERTHEVISKNFSFLTVKQLKNKIKTSVTFNELQKNHMDQNLLSVPNFSFWSKPQIMSYLQNRLIKKIRSYEKDQLKKALEENRKESKEKSRGLFP